MTDSNQQIICLFALKNKEMHCNTLNNWIIGKNMIY